MTATAHPPLPDPAATGRHQAGRHGTRAVSAFIPADAIPGRRRRVTSETPRHHTVDGTIARVTSGGAR